jgi:hypothetical protein
MPFVDEMPTHRLAIPDEDGQWFEVRDLSWKEIEECHREQQRKYMNRVKELGGELLKTVSEMESAAASDQQAAAKIEEAKAGGGSEGANLDPETLVLKSVVGWSYERRFQPALLLKLDDKTFRWLFGEIVKIYERSEEGKGSASKPSTTT